MNPRALIKLAKEAGYKGVKTAGQSLQGQEKELLVGATILGTAGASIAHKKGALETETLVDAAKVVGQGGLVLGAMAVAPKVTSQIIRKAAGKATGGRYRHSAVSEIPNYLPGFYGSGVFAPQLAVAKGIKDALPRIAKRFFNPHVGYASRKSGMGQKDVEMVRNVQAIEHNAALNLDKIAEKQASYAKLSKKDAAEALKADKKKIKDITKPVRDAQKELHHQEITSQSNLVLFGKEVPESFVAKYFDKFVKPVSEKKLISSVGEEVMANAVGAQGIKLGGATNYLQISSHPVQDVMRGMQFDRRAYNLFKRLGTGKFTADDVVSFARQSKLGNVKKLSDGRVQVMYSPSIKSNFNWGGYNGSLIFDPRKPGKVSYFATDKRDLFGVSLGQDTINVSQYTTKDIHKVLKELGKENLKKTQRHSTSAIRKETVKETAEDFELKKIGMRGSVSQADRRILDEGEKVFTKALKEDIPLADKAEFYATRAASLVSGGAVVYALGDE